MPKPQDLDSQADDISSLTNLLETMAQATKSRKTRRRAKIHSAYTTALSEVRAEAQESLVRQRGQERERQKAVMKKFRELVRRKEALEGEIRRVLRGVVEGVGAVAGVLGDGEE